jgi:ribosomal protein S18 acetylase RimI-like enzyme
MTSANVLERKRFYFSLLQNIDFCRLRNFLGDASLLYPNFDVWLHFKFLHGLPTGERKIAVAHDGAQIIGVALLKQNLSESKICTFYIMPKYRNLGVGKELMDFSLRTLDNPNTFITVADERKDELFPLLTSRGFKAAASCKDLYRELSTEYIFSL